MVGVNRKWLFQIQCKQTELEATSEYDKAIELQKNVKGIEIASCQLNIAGCLFFLVFCRAVLNILDFQKNNQITGTAGTLFY